MLCPKLPPPSVWCCVWASRKTRDKPSSQHPDLFCLHHIEWFERPLRNCRMLTSSRQLQCMGRLRPHLPFALVTSQQLSAPCSPRAGRCPLRPAAIPPGPCTGRPAAARSRGSARARRVAQRRPGTRGPRTCASPARRNGRRGAAVRAARGAVAVACGRRGGSHAGARARRYGHGGAAPARASVAARCRPGSRRGTRRPSTAAARRWPSG